MYRTVCATFMLQTARASESRSGAVAQQALQATAVLGPDGDTGMQRATADQTATVAFPSSHELWTMREADSPRMAVSNSEITGLWGNPLVRRCT